MLASRWVLSPHPSSDCPKELTGSYPAKHKEGLTETLNSAALGEGCHVPGVGTQDRSGLGLPAASRQCAQATLRKGAGKTGHSMGPGSVLISLSTFILGCLFICNF